MHCYLRRLHMLFMHKNNNRSKQVCQCRCLYWMKTREQSSVSIEKCSFSVISGHYTVYGLQLSKRKDLGPTLGQKLTGSIPTPRNVSKSAIADFSMHFRLTESRYLHSKGIFFKRNVYLHPSFSNFRCKTN